MQYILLVYDDPKAWPYGEVSEEEMKGIYEEFGAVARDKATKHSAQLQPTEAAKTIRFKNGSALVTDGPFAETKETLGGYYLVEADSIDDALKLAAKIPSARMGGSVEVRPVIEM
jgi:hypothetical protein